MKISFLPLLLLACVLASCLGYKELPVEYDYSYKGNFKKYRTFDIMKPAGLNDTTMVNELIEKSIIARMKFLGYRQVSNKPHLIIGFKMFSDSLKFNGYNQPDIEEWVRTQKQDLDYDPQKFNLKTGTLLIHFSNSRHLRNAVISILDKYRFWAEGFLEGGGLAQEEPDL
jgi:hypothetical protein